MGIFVAPTRKRSISSYYGFAALDRTVAHVNAKNRTEYGLTASTDSGATLRYLLYSLWRLLGHETLGRLLGVVILIDGSDDLLYCVFDVYLQLKARDLTIASGIIRQLCDPTGCPIFDSGQYNESEDIVNTTLERRVYCIVTPRVLSGWLYSGQYFAE